MRALKNFLLVSSGFVAIFVGIALASALVTATIAGQMRSAKVPQMSVIN
jgi:hypothetical protein